MISLTCTSCKKVLEIDDAFAGGVCRCQHCGTIQTVPSSLKNQPNAAGTGAKTLYQRKSRALGNDADAAGRVGKAVADAASPASDAASGSARVRAAAPEMADSAARRLPLVPLVIAAVVLLAVVGAFVAWLAG